MFRTVSTLEMLAWRSDPEQLWGNQAQLIQPRPEKKSDHRNHLTRLMDFTEDHNELRKEQPLAQVTGQLRKATGMRNSELAASLLLGHS